VSLGERIQIAKGMFYALSFKVLERLAYNGWTRIESRRF
jgi:hypothetical protein